MAGESYTPPPITGITPAGSHSEGHRANRRRFASYVIDGYTWVRKRLNGPGAMNYAFESLALSETTPIGPGVRQRQFWATVAPPLFVPDVTAPYAGLGGIVSGQTISQPLYNPYTNSYGYIQGPQQ